MAKREREESVPGLDTALPALAAAMAARPAADDTAAIVAVEAAEAQARQSLVAAMKARPVKAVVDVGALQAFKTQHQAMMKRTESASTATSIPSK